MLTIDGSYGEGGGQIVRTALALSLVTGIPFRIEKIRAGRRRPGLMRQHVTAVEAAAKVGNAEVGGATLGSQEITFRPSQVQPRTYTFSVGTAGSATLVLQTVLPALIRGAAPSTLTLEGGTHNPMAPPFDFLAKTFAPLISRLGPRITLGLHRPGFYPAGGGTLTAEILPAAKLGRLELLERGEVRARRARSIVAKLSPSIARRELQVVAASLGWEAPALRIEEVQTTAGPGNVLILEIESEHLTETFTGFGERGVRAEEVASQVVDEVREYLAAGVPVGKHLADQLMVPLALAGSGSFRTQPLSRHAQTQIAIIGTFLDLPVRATQVGERVWQVDVGG